MSVRRDFFSGAFDLDENQVEPKRVEVLGKLETVVQDSEGTNIHQRGFSALLRDVYGGIWGMPGIIIGELAKQIEFMPKGNRRRVLRRAAGIDAQRRARAKKVRG